MSDDNNNQIEFWNGEAGLKWVREQEKMEIDIQWILKRRETDRRLWQEHVRKIGNQQDL